MLARSRGVPMVVGLGADRSRRSQRGAGRRRAPALVVLSPGAAERSRFDERRAALRGARQQRAARYLHGAGGDRRRHADPRHGQRRRAGRPRRASTSATCDGVGLMRTEFLFSGAALPDEETQYRAYRQRARMGGRQAGDDPHPRRRRRQAGARPHDRRERIPSSACAASACRLRGRDIFRVQLRALARAAGARQPQGHAADGDGAGELDAAARAARRGARRAGGGRHRRSAAAARHHGRGAGGGDRAGAVRVGGVLLDRLQRPHAICHGRGARQRPRRRPERRDASGGAAPDRAASSAFGARTGMEVSLCGDAGERSGAISQRCCAPGLRSLSVAPAALAAVKAAIAGIRLGAADGG